MRYYEKRDWNFLWILGPLALIMWLLRLLVS